MPEEKRKSGWLTTQREKRRLKRERKGPSAEAQQEQRNSDKVFDPTAVARDANQKLGPPV
jgi:hypothetical protein